MNKRLFSVEGLRPCTWCHVLHDGSRVFRRIRAYATVNWTAARNTRDQTSLRNLAIAAPCS